MHRDEWDAADSLPELLTDCLSSLGPGVWQVKADDELSLGVFDLVVDGPGRRVRLFEGELPSDHKERKAEKPDLEALTALPAIPGYPFGALLGVGSGSKPSRQRAVLLRLDEHGVIDGDAVHVDLAPLYQSLRARFDDLNIEGLFTAGSEFCLLRRGNRKSGVNAYVVFDGHEVARWIQRAATVPAAQRIEEFDLGDIDGVPLCFTDGAPLQRGGWVFCAAAEVTSDSYADGRCVGSAVGIVDAGVVEVSVPPLADEVSRARRALGALAFSPLFDGVSRAAVRGQAWARIEEP